MSGGSISPQSLDKLSIQFDLDGATDKIECVVTRHGHLLLNSSQYAAAFTGCVLKDASNKLAVVASRFPKLQHGNRLLCDHDKVSLAIPDVYFISYKLFVNRSNLNSCHISILVQFFTCKQP